MRDAVYENVVKEVDNLLNKRIEDKYQKVISDIDKIISNYGNTNHKNQINTKQNLNYNKETIISIPSLPDKTIIKMYEVIDKIKK